jgi:hypothetical protein
MVTILLIFMFSKLFSQSQAPPTLSLSTQTKKGKMSSYLNGIARNHVEGYNRIQGQGSNTKELKFVSKVDRYNSIDNNFSNGGRKIYRLGHNISDGNLGYAFGPTWQPYELLESGWHWASRYGDGFVAEYAASIPQQNPPGRVISILGLPNIGGIISTRLGAGVRRYIFSSSQASEVKDQNFSGFAVTVNYRNSISEQMNFSKLPKSTTLYTSSICFKEWDQANNKWIENLRQGVHISNDYLDQVRKAIPAGCKVVQVGGPYAGQNVLKGWYEFDFRITNPSGEVAYWGFILSVKDASISGPKLVRMQGDEHILIDPDKSLFPFGTSALLRHSVTHSVTSCKLSNDPGANEVDIYSSSTISIIDNAFMTGQYGYDDIEYTIAETRSFQADLAVVVNIATGYPEETEGLIEYLQESGVNVAFIELGSELMGSWNKGALRYPNECGTNPPPLNNDNYTIACTPSQLAQTTLPFAVKIKNSGNGQVAGTKVALTNSYNQYLDFYCQGGLPGVLLQEWLSPLMGYIDYVNVHTYPGSFLSNKHFTPQKSVNLIGSYVEFETKVLPEIKSVIKGSPIEIIITEAHTGFEAHNVNSPPVDAQPSTITEAFYFSEGFISAAKAELAAFIPFAFFKQARFYNHGNNPNVNDHYVVNHDPTNPQSWFAPWEDPSQQLHFFGNTEVTNAQYTDVFVKPVFKAKEMIFENLGAELIKSYQLICDRELETTEFKKNASDPNDWGSPYNEEIKYPVFGILPTFKFDRDKSKQTINILITNRDALNPDGQTPLKIVIDGVTISQGKIMVIDGRSFNDKQPTYTSSLTGTIGSLAFTTKDPNVYPVAFNNENALLQDVTWVGNDGLLIPNYSICILKVPVPQLSMPIVCPTVTFPPTPGAPAPPAAIGIACDAINVTWSDLGNTTCLTSSVGVYYYEQLDGQGVIPTGFDNTDPHWKHYADYTPVSCGNATIYGLQLPQDEYQIAVVTRYSIQSPNYVGPRNDSISCLTSARTGWCEDRIDKAHISVLSQTGAQCVTTMLDLANVQFCGAQIIPIPVVTQCDNDFEITLSGDFKIDAVRLYCGTKSGSIEVSVDNGTGYQNNPFFTAISGIDTWLTMPLKTSQGCSGIEHVQRIRFRLQHGDDQIRKVVLQGKPLDGISNTTMPICCGSSTAIVVTEASLLAAKNNNKILVGQPQELRISPTNGIFTLDGDHTFDGCKIYVSHDVQIIKPASQPLTKINLFNSQIKGCEFRWNGIRFEGLYELGIQNTTIADMDEGLVLKPNSRLTKTGIENSNFVRNKASIQMLGNNAITNQFVGVGNFIRSVTIEGTNLNIKPKTSSPSLMERADFGLNIDGMGQVVAGNSQRFKTGLDIKNVNKPIVANNSSAIQLYNILVNNDNHPSTDGIKAEWVGTFILSNYYFDIWPLYTGYTGVHISGVENAIRTRNVGYSLVNGVSTKNVHNGFLARNFRYQTNVVENNIFNVLSSGILAEWNSSTSVYSYNGVSQYINPALPSASTPTSFQGLYGGMGIGLASGNKAVIEGNQIGVRRNPDHNVVHGGIVLLQGKSHNVRNNRISLQNNIIEHTPRFYGIYSLNPQAAGHAFCGNEITGLQGYDRGIGANNGINTLYTCNRISNTRQSLYYLGNNENADAITGNALADSPFGVYVNSDAAAPVLLGEQDRRANQFINNWSNGGFWEGAQTITNNGQTINLVQESKFINNRNAPFWPITSSSPLDWFEQTTDPNETISCSPGLQANCQDVNPPIVTEPPVVGIGKLAENASALQEPYRSTVLRQTYAQAKANYPDGNYPQDVQAFLSHNDQSGFAQLADLDAQIQDILQNAPNVKSDLVNTETAITLSYAYYKAYLQNLDLMPFAERINNQSTPPQYVTVFEDRLELFADLQESATMIANQNLDALITANNQLQPDNAYIALEQEANRLTWSAIRDSRDLTVSELAYIKSIADKCPQEYGDAVAKARATWLAHGGGLQNAWEICNPDTQESQNQGKSMLQFSQPTEQPQLNPNELVVYPVPLADLFRVSIPSEYVGADYQLISSTGTIVSTGIFKSTLNELDCTTCATGMYLIRVNHPNYRPVNLKIVVQKL